MFGSLGGPELILILVIALIVFGPRRLPDIGKSVGKMLVEFRRASNDFKRTIEEEVESEKRSLDAATAPPTVKTTTDPATGATAPVVSTMGLGAPAPPGGAVSDAPANTADEARPQPPGTLAQAAAPTPSEPA